MDSIFCIQLICCYKNHNPALFCHSMWVMPKEYHLFTSVVCSHFCYLTVSLTKTNTKKGKKIISFQLGYFIHPWSGFSVFPTDVNPSPGTVVSSHAKGKKKQTKGEVMEPRQFQFFQILQFPKKHWVDGLSIYTWGKIAEVYLEWKSFQLGSKEGIRCLFPSSLLTLWIWRPSPVNSSLRDKNTRKEAKGVLDMFLDLEKRQN